MYTYDHHYDFGFATAIGTLLGKMVMNMMEWDTLSSDKQQS